MNTLELLEPEKRPLAGENIIQLPYGLLGFEKVKDYILLSRPNEQPFMWLQMLQEAKHAFLVVSPFLVVRDYQPDISDEDVKFLKLTGSADAIVVNIVTLRGDGTSTINLKGPVVINHQLMIGKQVIPNNAAQYASRHPLPVS